jgi:hypothetical protein
MIPKKLAPAKAGVAGFSDEVMRKTKSTHDPEELQTFVPQGRQGTH